MASTSTTARDRLALGGAALFALWGVLHLVVGVVFTAAGLASPRPWSELERESIMFFASVIVLGAATVVVAGTLNRTNSWLGFWLNVLLTVPIDAALVLVQLESGHLDPVGGVTGPAIVVLAVGVSLAALLRPGRLHGVAARTDGPG
jgi:hypothetical protein